VEIQGEGLNSNLMLIECRSRRWRVREFRKGKDERNGRYRLSVLRHLGNEMALKSVREVAAIMCVGPRNVPREGRTFCLEAEIKTHCITHRTNFGETDDKIAHAAKRALLGFHRQLRGDLDGIANTEK